MRHYCKETFVTQTLDKQDTVGKESSVGKNVWEMPHGIILEYFRILKVLRISIVIKLVQFFSKTYVPPLLIIPNLFFYTKHKYCSEGQFYYIWKIIELKNTKKCKII